MDHAEKVAKLILEAALPGATMKYRCAQSNGEYDFDLNRDGVLAAVEVTSAVDQIQARTNAAIGDKKKGGSIIKAVLCKKSWRIFPSRDARINEIRKKSDRYLAEVESAGIERFHWVRGGPQCVQKICTDLGLLSGSAFSSGESGSPMIYISLIGGGGAVGPSDAIDAGEKEARKADNRKKLGAAITDERHLVVYISPMNGLAWVALTDLEPPSTIPDLPREVTQIWLVAESGGGDLFVVWHGTTTKHWEKLELPRKAATLPPYLGHWISMNP